MVLCVCDQPPWRQEEKRGWHGGTGAQGSRKLQFAPWRHDLAEAPAGVEIFFVTPKHSPWSRCGILVQHLEDG
jgi:hypothetical protein